MQNGFDSMRQKVDVAAFEMDKRARIGRVQKQVDEVNRQIAEAVAQVGAKALELYRNGQLTVPELLPLCQAMLSLEGQVVGLQAQIAVIQQEVMPQDALACPHCHAPVMAEARFCPSCGQSLVAPPVVQPGPTCPGCGSPTVIGAAYCGNCGYRLISDAPQPPVAIPSDATSPPSPVQIAEPVAQPVAQPTPESPPVVMPPGVASPIPPVQVAGPVSMQEPAPPAVPVETVPRLPVCPHCGAPQRRADVKFCRVCGKSMAVLSGSPALTGTAAVPGESSQ